MLTKLLGSKLNSKIIQQSHDHFCRNLKERSKWCAAFTKKDLELLEYGGDLLTYYKNAYGNKYSAQLGCATLKYLFDYTEKRLKGNHGWLVYFVDSREFSQMER